jgi:hypothetical protein
VRFFNLDRLRRIGDDVDRGWPGYLLGGRVRTSTVVLILVFAALWWIYDDHQRAVESSPKTTQVPATQVVPPGYVPDPNYTWVPRTQVQEPTPTVTVTPTPTPTTSPTPPPLFPPIVLSPPFGPPVTSTPSPPPNPAPAPPVLPPLPGLP